MVLILLKKLSIKKTENNEKNKKFKFLKFLKNLKLRKKQFIGKRIFY